MVIVILSLLAAVGVGVWFSRKQNSTKAYFAANGSVPAWAVGMSMFATIISSVTFLAYPGAAYAGNWILLVQGLMVPIVLLGMIWFIVPLFRRVIGFPPMSISNAVSEPWPATTVRRPSSWSTLPRWEPFSI